MTYEEAIRVIESNRPTSGYTMLCEALDIAKEAIEKQIPTKVMRKGHTIVCPNCNECLDFPEILNYCYSCGQALDWSDTK